MTVEETQRKTIESMEKVIGSMSVQMAEMSQQIKELTAQIAWFQRQIFGSKSEKRILVDPGPSLFDFDADPAPATSGEAPPEPQMETITRKSQKGITKTRQSWEDLPVLETRTIEPEGLDLNRYRRIGEEISYQVGFEPGKLYRIATVRPKYGLIDPTEPVERGKGVLIAPMPPIPIPKGIPSASLLCEVLLQKYEYHVPFYRQIKQFAHLGMTGLKETTLTGWFKRTMELLRPLYELLVAKVFRSTYIQADETTTPVINSEKHRADKEYLWMARAVMEKTVVFFYDEGSRAGSVIKEKTDEHGFKGYLQCDGFGGYTAAFKPGTGVTLVNCLVHIRRHWEQALDENRKAASWFLGKIREIYRIDHRCDKEGLDDEGRKAVRQEEMRPIMEEVKTWMETEGLGYSPRSLTGQAVTYAYTRWQNMMHVLDDGRLRLDNNLAENEIRPITLGRKNYLFCGNHEAAANMCVIQSLLATCRNHNINPRLYLTSVIESMPRFENASDQDLSILLPHRWKEHNPGAVMATPVRQVAK